MALITVIAQINGEDKVIESDPTTIRPRVNKGFKPKFVRILTQDEVNKSNDNTVPRKFTKINKIRDNRYGTHANSPIQMIYKVEEVAIQKVKPFVPCKCCF